jgi:hypothetical protein
MRRRRREEYTSIAYLRCMKVPLPLLLFFPLAMPGSASSAEVQWILSAYGGAIHTAPAGIVIEQPSFDTALTFPKVSFRSASSEPPIYYGYRVARAIPAPRWLFIEAEFIHAKLFARDDQNPRGLGLRNGVAAADVPFSSVVQSFGMSHGFNFILVNAVLRRPLRSGRLTLTGRGGAGPMRPHVETEVEGRRREGYQWAGVALQAGGGIELRVWRRISVLAEYKRTHGSVRVSVDHGTAFVTARSHHVASGLTATF